MKKNKIEWLKAMILFDIDAIKESHKMYKENQFKEASEKLNEHVEAMYKALKLKADDTFQYHFDMMQSNIKNLFDYAEFLDKELDKLMDERDNRE